MGPKAQVEGGSWLGGDSRQVISVSSVKEGKSLLGMWWDMWAGLRRPEKLKKSDNEVISQRNPSRWFGKLFQ